MLYQIQLIANNQNQIDQIEEQLTDLGAISISYDAYDDQEIFEPEIGSTPFWQNTQITALFNLDNLDLIDNLKEIFPELTYQIVKDQDWVRAWLDYFQPIKLNPNFWIAAQEHNPKDYGINDGATILRLDPGLAFGTGTHPSTFLCLDYLVNQINLKDKIVYDYGCGSGILGIASALCGAKKVYQTDIDPQALIASKENADKNSVQNQIQIYANPNEAPLVDIIIANILLDPLCNLKNQFEKHLKKDGKLYFAGLLTRQQTIIADYYQNDYFIDQVASKDDWILLQLTPRN